MGDVNVGPVIFHCFGGSHSSIIAAAIRCGHITCPSAASILHLPWFDLLPRTVVGIPVPVGEDATGREVFVLGRCGLGSWVDEFVPLVLTALGLPVPTFVNCSPASNMALKIGGLLSRRLGIRRAGRPLLVAGIMRAWEKLAALAATDVDVAEGKRPVAIGPTLLIVCRNRVFARVAELTEGNWRIVVAHAGVRTKLATTILASLVSLVDEARIVTVVDWEDIRAGFGRRSSPTGDPSVGAS